MWIVPHNVPSGLHITRLTETVGFFAIDACWMEKKTYWQLGVGVSEVIQT